MTTRSTKLFAGSLVGRPAGQMYLVPEGFVAIIKSIYVTPHGASSGTTAVVLRSNSPAAVVNLISADAIPETSIAWDGWVVLESGDEVLLTWETGQFDYLGSGALLPVPF